MAEGANSRAARKPANRFERISGWLTLAANLGVLGGIVLVIVQLNQNERMIRAQTRHEIAMGIVEHLSAAASNPQLAEASVRYNEGGELTPVEQYQVQLRIGALLRLWEDEHYQYRMGLYDEEEFARERDNWRDVLRTNRGILTIWCRNRGNYSAEFAAEVNRLIDQRACEAARP